MIEPTTTDNIPRFEVRLTSDSHFSWLRTRMSLERTLMSWVRTAISLIGFGFTIVQFFERVQGMEGFGPQLRPQAPRLFGLALILCGIIALAISAWQYRNSLRYLSDQPFTPLAGIQGEVQKTPVLAVSMLLLLIGLATFFSLLMRLA